MSSSRVRPWPGSFHGLLGVEKQVDHLVGPVLVEVLDDAGELSEVVRVA